MILVTINLVLIKVLTTELGTPMKKLIRTWLEATPSTIKSNRHHKKKRVKIGKKKETINGPRRYQDCLVMMLQLSILKGL
jgi:hypothetical protein